MKGIDKMLKDFSKEKFDVIIQAGQSNSDGCGLGNVENPFIPREEIWYLNNNFTISLAKEEVSGDSAVGNFSLPFAEEYISGGNLKNGRKVLIIRAAIGGTGFLDRRWGMTDDLYLTMIEMIITALELNPENKLVAFIWHQGETDAVNEASHDVHYKNLKTLVESVRIKFNCNDLPFVAGDFVQHWKNDNIKICEPVVKAIRDVCADIGNAKFVETDGMQSNLQKLGVGDDNIHFSREAIYLLGKKYYDAFCELMK